MAESDADLAPDLPEGVRGRAPKWKGLLAKSLARAEKLVDHEDDRIAGAMVQSLLAIAARTGVWHPGAADEGRVQGPQIRLTIEQTRLVAQGDAKAIAELDKLVKLAEKRGPVSQLEAGADDDE